MQDKNILLFVTGGIAVYKALSLTSKLTQSGAHVRVVMSESAAKFVTPLSFQALSRNTVYTDTFIENDPEKIAHIDLADWADLILVAPATANTIGKLANGIADNMVTTTIIASTDPVMIFPAMNCNMFSNKSVERNMEILKKDGYLIQDVAEGYLACGHTGKGRMQEADAIFEIIEKFFSNQESKPLNGKNILITAGPTIEKIDPIRYISNFSSGKMGYALAKEAAQMGANVTLVSGPVKINAPHGVEVVSVTTVQEMYEKVNTHFDACDCFIASAAVSDYIPEYTDHKIKKHSSELTLKLSKSIDILKTMGQRKTTQFVVGFAAETNDGEQYALSKLEKKNLDMVVLNDVTLQGAGFGTDTNIVTIYQKDQHKISLDIMSKEDVANKILLEIAKNFMNPTDN